MTKDEALDLALKVMQINLTLLEKINPYRGQEDLLSDSLDLTHKAITAIKQALAAPVQEMHRYSPDGEGGMEVDSLGAYVKLQDVTTPPEAPMQDSTCRETLRAQGKAYPRTCRKCGKGPCIGAPKPPPAQPAPMQSCYCLNCEAMGKELAALKAQPAPVPLTDEQADAIALDVMGFAVLDKEQRETARMIIRNTEAAHGITKGQP